VDIEGWLRGLGLERYAQAFRANDIDEHVLPNLKAQDLRDMGVTSVGHRRRLLEALATLSSEVNAPPSRPRQPASARAGRAERRQLTVMFVDLVGSTALSAQLDPEEMQEVLRRYQDTVVREIGRFEGYVAKLMGDGVLAYFGWPRAHEDEAERAVRAALAISAAVPRLTGVSGQPLAARIGISTGLVLVGDLVSTGVAQEETVVGETPNLAARLQGLGAPGDIMICGTCRKVCAGTFLVEELGVRSLHGFHRPMPVFRILGERPGITRFEARAGRDVLPMVGRDQELGLLFDRWRQAKTGLGQCILLVGEAGIGKSRIVRAVRDQLREERVIVLRYQCSPFHADTPLWPIAQQLAHAAGFAADDSIAGMREKLERLLASAVDDVGAVVPLVAALVGLDLDGAYPRLELTPPQQRIRTLQALLAQLEGLAAQAPVLFLFEDVHWIDPTSLELIERLVERIGDKPVLALLTARPLFKDDLGGHPHVTRLTLNRLGRRAAEIMVRRLAGKRRLSVELAARIITETDGVPLFVEEVTKAVLEAGPIGSTQADEGGRATSPVRVPATLYDSLMTRLDRLRPLKEVAQIAACIGREFDHSLLVEVAGMAEAELDAALVGLVAAELLFRRGTPPSARYTFKHALLRDAAYESVLKARRQHIHAAILDALERRAAPVEPELRAQHAAAAGWTDRAIDLWQEAGLVAAERSANAEAVRHLKAALQLLRSTPVSEARDRREFDLLVALGVPLIAVKGYASPEVEADYGRACTLCEQLDEQYKLFGALRGLWNCIYDRGELERSLQLARRLVSVGHRQGAEERALAWRALGSTHLSRGEFEQALKAFDEGIAAHRHLAPDTCVRAYGESPHIVCTQYTGWIHAWCGRLDTALVLLRQGTDEARSLRHPISLAFAGALLGVVHALRRDVEACAAVAEQVRALSKEHGFVFWMAHSEIFLGWTQVQAGGSEHGLNRIRQGIADWRATGAELHVPTWSTFLADALLLAGRQAEAREVLEAALDLAVARHELCVLPELHRLRGKLLVLEGRADDAAAALEQALAIARHQGAALYERRAVRDLAEMLIDQNDRSGARIILAPALASCSEGLGTPDVDEAQRLFSAIS
jgi:predicted ATPase/class 3 adenylate cyclase